MARQLMLDSIRSDGQTQSRERVNEETVAEYAEAMGAPAAGNWPPVTVFFDGTDYWLADGFHRVLAARRLGRKNIMGDVKKGTREDAAWASCAANQSHGLRRTNADKRKAVEIALKLHPEMSARAISDHCGVGDDLVNDVRVRCRNPTPDRVVGKDGKRYAPPTQPTDRQGFGPPPRPEEWRGAAGVPGGGSPTSHASLGTPGNTADADSLPVDDMGRRLPEHLLELWGRRQEVQDMLTALSRVRVALREAQDNRDPLYSEVPHSSALMHLDQAYNAVQVAKPYAVCAFCQGHGCKVCGQRGLLGKFRWDTTVPKEHKEAVARLIEKERSGCR